MSLDVLLKDATVHQDFKSGRTGTVCRCFVDDTFLHQIGKADFRTSNQFHQAWPRTELEIS